MGRAVGVPRSASGKVNPLATDDRAASTLTAIKDRWAARKGFSLGFDPVDGISLVAAVEAALKLADEIDRHGLWLPREREPDGGQMATDALRAAIITALTGKE